jgi:hypothetical protein
MRDAMPIRSRVRQVAEAKGVKMSALQRTSGISMTSMRNLWFSTNDGTPDGEPLRQIHLPSLYAVARILGVRPLELLEEFDEK